MRTYHALRNEKMTNNIVIRFLFICYRMQNSDYSLLNILTQTEDVAILITIQLCTNNVLVYFLDHDTNKNEKI